jgi:O-antigen/teichoic acid export membrane protein
MQSMRKKILAKSLGISVLNQGLSSATNLVLGLFLLRVLEPIEYGLFGIGFAVVLFYSGTGNALLLTQMTVNIAHKPMDTRANYAFRMFVLTVNFVLVTFILLALVLFALNLTGSIPKRGAGFSVSAAAASTAYLLKEFFVRHAYNMRQEIWALLLHGVLAITLVSSFLAIVWIGVQLSATMVLQIYALALLISAILGYSLAQMPVKRPEIALLRLDLVEAWRGGFFSTLSHLIISLRSQAHIIVLAATLGPAAIAFGNAARIMISPINMLNMALSQALLPRLVSAGAEGQAKMNEVARSFLRILMFTAIGYSALVLVSYDQVEDFIIGDKYEGLFFIMAMWSILAMLTAYKTGIELVLIARKRFSEQAIVNAAGAFVSLAAVYALSTKFGVAGAIAGLSIAETVVIVLMRLRVIPGAST